MGTDRGDDDIRLYRTLPHDCGYFGDRLAQDLAIDPKDPRLNQVYPGALNLGFRRSGGIVYRPDCETCNACVAVRVPVDAFRANRTQRRCIRNNQDLTHTWVGADRTDEQLELYQRYLGSRHANGGMDDHQADDFDQFLLTPWAQTEFLELRLDDRLVAVAVTDTTPAGLSAVYTFFDPDLSQRSLGTYAILSQIRRTHQLNLPHLYLGYWIQNHPKMDYKRQFSALERLTATGWKAFQSTKEDPCP